MEFAMVAPVLFLLLFGIIDFGVVYSRQLGVRTSTREVTRKAVIGQFGGDPSCVMTGLTPSTNEPLKEIICSIKSDIPIDAADVRVQVMFVDSNGDGTADHTHYDDLMVCTMAQMHSATGFFGPVLNSNAHKARLTMLLEKAPDIKPSIPTLVAGGEAPLTGQDWAFCSPSAGPV
ncbi:MAG: pilus assembly protein [Microthrixaceae bacterium]|nr:pilus assembly protein [Microthrixaceae bacterium]